MGRIRVVIVDDNPPCREALRLVLERANDIEVVGEAENGESGVRVACIKQPDVVLMDAQMPGMDGIEATRRIRSRIPGQQVICLTSYPDAHDDALAAGAAHVILKDSPPSELLDVIRRSAAPLRVIGA